MISSGTLLVLVACMVSAVEGQEPRLYSNGQPYPACPTWSAWRTSQCFWPSMPRESYPCTRMNPSYLQYPPWIQQQFYTERQFNWYARVRADWEQRGRPAMCGQCAVRWRCRERVPEPNEQLPDLCAYVGRRPSGGDGVHRSLQDEPVSRAESNCAGTQPCELEPVDGVCAPPGFVLTDDDALVNWIRAGGAEPFNYDKFATADNVHTQLERKLDEMDGKLGDIESRLVHRMVFRVRMLNRILNRTNCAQDAASGRCLCCCAPYMPNVQTRQCVDVASVFEPELRRLFGQIEQLLGEKLTLSHDDPIEEDDSETDKDGDGFDLGELFKQIVDSMTGNN